MPIRGTCAALCIFGLVSLSTSAALGAEETGLVIELNKIEQTGSGCRLTFKTSNRLPVNLQFFSVELYLLDPKGVALESVQFTFGAVATSKARFSKFDLSDHPCSEIGGIFVNEVKSCVADTEIAQQCRDGLRLKNLTPITFTDGAS